MSAAIQAVEALLQHHPAAGRSFTDFEALFNSNDDFLTKVKSFDQLLDQYRQLDDIGEYIFDLLMIHHLEKNNNDEDYFDSKEWLDIEDKTLERGTELLNILLYISESRETDAPVSLDDFLYEFLLVDEDEFQDEHRIYESLIEHNELVDEDMDNIRAVANELPESSEIKELFVPIVLFFQNIESNAISNNTYKTLEPVERSLLACLLSYKQV